MKETLVRQVEETIVRYKLLQPGDTVLVALSGGPDSVALLIVLNDLKQPWDLDLHAVHVNHRTRGAESDEDEGFVRLLCDELGISLTVQYCSPEEDGNLEAALRNCRYHHLGERASVLGATVATGHTLNDQAETVLLNLFRGAGHRGLSGIAPIRRAPEWGDVLLIRPLIECTRQSVLEFLSGRDQQFRQDSSNDQWNLDRNWVRGFLLPRVCERLNPEVAQALSRTAGMQREIIRFLESESLGILDRCRRDGADILVGLSEFRKLYAPIRKELVRQCFQRSTGTMEGLSHAHVDSVEDLLGKQPGSQVVLPGGLRVLREFEHLRFTRRSPAVSFRKELQIPGEMQLEELGRRLRIQEAQPGEEGCLFMECSPVQVRNWVPGDRFIVSQGKTSKLKSLFLEAKVPREERLRRVLLEQNGEIVWVEGLGPAFYSREPSSKGRQCFRVEVLKL